jgi:signal transduction histidine kinase
MELEKFLTEQRRWRRFVARVLTRRKLAATLGFLLACAVVLSASGEDAAAPAPNTPRGGSALDPKYGVGDWIWAPETREEQTCRLWRRVDIPKDSSVARARLTMAADDAYRLFVDGREIGQGTSWYKYTEYDLTLILGPGAHILGVECFNESLAAGLLAGLRVQLEDGRSIEVPSDRSWRVVPDEEKNWTTRRNPGSHWATAVIVAKYGEGPWKGRQIRFTSLPAVQPSIITFWQSEWFRILMFSICGALAALCLWLVAKLAVYSQAQQVVRRERARIARDIHDDLTAGLTQLVLFGEVARNELPQESEARRQVAKVCEKARGLSQAMNEIIWMVNSQRDTFHDFTSYICKYAEMLLEATPIRCRFEVEEEMPDLPCDLGVRRNLFLGVKEALTNAARHSDASELLLRVYCPGQQIVVAVEDNGKGFDSASGGRQGNGLPNMGARAAEAGGVCRITSQPGAGCRVEFAVPLARATGQRLRFWGRLASPQVRVPPAQSAKRARGVEAGAADGRFFPALPPDATASPASPARRTPAP